MSAQQVLCRVRALYAYESTDPSSLSFKPNVILDVLAQLESGWWDGWYDGKRGWFPSNYVEIIDEPPPFQQQLELEQPWHPSSPIRPRQRINNNLMEQKQKNQLRLSLYATDHLMTEPKETDWILQTTEDGSDQYYYNSRTQEMRNSIPPEGFLNQDMQWINANGNPNNSNEMLQHHHHHHHHHQQQQQQHQQPRIMEKPARPVRAANRIIDEQHHQFNTPLSPQSEATFQRSSMDDMLPPNWIRKVTPKGRYYYFNIKTEETTLELENIDPDTGALMATPVELLPSLPNQEPLDPALSESHHGVSWPILSSSLAQALFKLKESIQLGNTPEFSHQVTDIVHRIRFLLYVSGCLDKDTSVYLKSNKQLRNYHRTLLATIAKLVLSAKVASGTHSHEARIKLQIDTDEVLAAIREFMTCAQDMQLEIHESKPSLIYTGLPPPPKNISTNGNRLNTANPEAIATFAEHTKTALHSLMDNLFSTFSHFQRGDLLTTLDRLKVNAPLLVAQFRNLSNTTSHFLNFIEQVCQVQLPVERVTALTASKQPIYSAMGSLFIISQIITNSEIDGKQLEEIWANLEECTRTIEASIQDCVDIVKMKLQPPPPPQLPSTPMPTVPPEEQFYQQQKHQKTSSTLGSMASHRSRHESDKSGFVRKQDDGEDAESDIDENVNGVHVYSDQELDEFDDEDDDDLSIENEIGNVRPKTELKIFKFFGEDTIAAARRRDTTMLSPTASSAASIMTGGNLTLNNSVVNEVPWYMTSDIEPGDLIMNMEGNVKGGTLATLIKKLTQHDQLDSKFNSTFLLTYRSFCTTEDLFGHLFERYDLPIPENLSEEEFKTWKDKKLKLVRLRVFNVIKSWLETYFNDEEDRDMLPIIEKFTETSIAQSMSFGAEQLTKVIKKRMSADDSSNQIKKMKLNVRTEDMPTPILPRNMKRIRLLELDPLELARQMTSMDFKLYVGIQPVECLDKNWGKPDDESGTHIAANVKASIEHSNQVTAWVTDSILSKDEVRKRSLVIKHWIYVAERCRMLNNFNTCMAILSAFDNGSIGRLKRTWEMISARTMQILQNIRRVLGANRNFAEYRELIRKVNPPCLPFLGIYLQDLTFIEDGNTNFLKKTDDLINFAKRMKTADIIRDLQQYQSTHYMLNPVPEIQEFIQSHLYSSREEEELYNLSLKLEPRTKGEDTILKRLKDSGL